MNEKAVNWSAVREPASGIGHEVSERDERSIDVHDVRRERLLDVPIGAGDQRRTVRFHALMIAESATGAKE
jgi:hypothetical protein